MSQLFNFSFQNLQSTADSPGAISKNQVVYAYATQSTKTLLVLTNGDSRITDNTLASVKSDFGLTSIGSPTRANGQVISLNEVLVNSDYVTQIFNDTATRRVEMNQPASAPVVFTTTATIPAIVSASTAAEKGYAEFVCRVSQVGTGAPTLTTIKNEISESVAAARTASGTYTLTFTSIASTIQGGTLPANNGSLNVTVQPGNTTIPLISSALSFLAGRSSTSAITITSLEGSTATDGLLTNAMIQVRLYY